MRRLLNNSRILRLIIPLLCVVMLFSLGRRVEAQDANSAKITAPKAGDSLSGNITISGTATNPTMNNYVLEFASIDNSPDQWFPISAPVSQQVTNGVLGQWNSSVVPDGKYKIRLRVVKRDGTQIIDEVDNLIVTNKPPTELPTPLPTASLIGPTLTFTPGPSPTPAIQQPPTSTLRLAAPSPATGVPSITNATPEPASSSNVLIQFDSITNAFCGGVWLAIGGFIVFGLYRLVRNRVRK